MQAPPIDFQCSLTILAALRAVCVFVPRASAVMQLLFSVHLKMIYNHKEMTDLCLRSDCMSEHSYFTLLRHVVSVICLHFICVMEVFVCRWLMGRGRFLTQTQGCLM